MNRLSAAAAFTLFSGVAFATPDIICGTLDDSINHGQVGTVRAYSFGTTACNKGDSPANWISDSLNHPVISTSMFKLDTATGRMIQLGVAWPKHSFASLQGNACGFGCAGDGGWQALGSGCSDPYGASLNASQGGLGPRFEINAYTGQYIHPPLADGQTGNAVYKRLQVPAASLDTNASSLYFVEGMYVALDDAQVGNQMNNVSYRRYNINSSLSFNGFGSTVREVPAIFAWQLHGNGYNNPDNSLTISQVDVPGEGRFYVASKAVDLGNGTWRYEYALYNQNSHRSAGSISIPVNTGTSNYGFNDITYHSGEPYSSTDWTPSDDGTKLSWSTEDYSVNQNANAVRWGTMYNFWFETDAAPTTGDVELGLFRPGSPSSLSAAAVVPTADTGCPADLAEPFGVLNIFDIQEYLGAYNSGKPSADLAEPFGVFNIFDIQEYLALYNAGCP